MTGNHRETTVFDRQMSARRCREPLTGALGLTDDLRLFTEVVRRGRLTKAANHLQINHTTVSRHPSRASRAEPGVRPHRGRLGSDGRRSAPGGACQVDRIDSPCVQTDCRSRDSTLTGNIRIITPDGFRVYVHLPGPVDFQRQHPEFDGRGRHGEPTRLADTSRVRPFGDHRASAGARGDGPAANYSLAFYASERHLDTHPPVTRTEDLNDQVLIWYVDSALDQQTLSLLHEVLPMAEARIQTNNIAGFVQAAETDLGIALLPTFIVDSNPRLQRITTVNARIESLTGCRFPATWSGWRECA